MLDSFIYDNTPDYKVIIAKYEKFLIKLFDVSEILQVDFDFVEDNTIPRLLQEIRMLKEDLQF